MCYDCAELGFEIASIRQHHKISLSEAGLEHARQLARGHRLWEAYTHEKLGMADETAHDFANEMEHFLDEDIVSQLQQDLQHPKTSPHGKPIPEK